MAQRSAPSSLLLFLLHLAALHTCLCLARKVWVLWCVTGETRTEPPAARRARGRSWLREAAPWLPLEVATS